MKFTVNDNVPRTKGLPFGDIPDSGGTLTFDLSNMALIVNQSIILCTLAYI